MGEPLRILVTGAAGQVGAVGFKIVQLLCAKEIRVRAMVHRIDERSEALARLGAEVIAGDLTNPADVQRAMRGCKRMYFGMSVSPSYLEAAMVVAAVAKQPHQELKVIVNMSQLTVSEMDIDHMTSSRHQRLHWLAEQAFNWSGLPVVHVRPTVFQEHFFFNQWAAESIIDAGELRLPFGSGRTSPIAAADVARVVATILHDPTAHVGKVYELTGPESLNLDAIAAEYSKALGRPVKAVNVPLEEWASRTSSKSQLPPHVLNHILTMADLHHDNRYDRLRPTVEQLTGIAPMSIQRWVEEHRETFTVKA